MALSGTALFLFLGAADSRGDDESLVVPPVFENAKVLRELAVNLEVEKPEIHQIYQRRPKPVFEPLESVQQEPIRPRTSVVPFNRSNQ